MIIDRITKKSISALENCNYINTEEDLATFFSGENIYRDNVIHVPEKLLHSKSLHYYYFIGKKIMVTITDECDVGAHFLNPMITYIEWEKPLNLAKYPTKCHTQDNIQNIMCHIDLQKILENTCKSLNEVVGSVWGNYMAYNIYNFPPAWDSLKVYENLANHLGVIRKAHPVNDKSTKFSTSRDIKFDPRVPHYYASNSRQPLHTDYAYYPLSGSPDWLMLYCIQPSEFGGITSLLSTKTLNKILERYNKGLLENLLTAQVVYHYLGEDGDKVHTKRLFDGKYINWNYYQIKRELNSELIMDVREEFFHFLEDTITSGQMFDFSKVWNSGDCIIFNDHLMLHGRSAFLGDRWLKDHAFYNKEKDHG